MLNPFYATWIVGVLLMGLGNSIAAHDRDTSLAFMFAYAPKTGAADLANGYKKHLEWHIERNDPILWYGWFVVEGERLDYFIDGAFDITGAEFDSRPDPAGDAEDATANFLPVADPLYRRVNRLRKDLSTSSFLEERRPSPLMQVVHYHVRPGKQGIFEAVVSEITEAARRANLPYAIYETLTGSNGAVYSLYVPLNGFRDFDTAALSIESVAHAAMSEDSMSSAMTQIALAAESTYSEVWQYRSDLSLIPEQQ